MHPPLDTPPAPGNRLRRSVLVVDDNPTIRQLLTYVLKTAYEVEVASCVEDALRAARTKRFDALVLDINLGEARTGIDLLELLRGMPAYQTVPAVACTASLVPGARKHLFRAGFDACVDKPFTRERLHGALERLFRTRYVREGNVGHFMRGDHPDCQTA